MVQPATEKATQLLDVDAGLRFVQAMKQQSLLQGRERIDIFGSRIQPSRRFEQRRIGRPASLDAALRLRIGPLNPVSRRLRQFRDRLMLEQMPRRERQALRLGARNNLQAENGIPPQLEEIIVDTDMFHTQYLCPDRRQLC